MEIILRTLFRQNSIILACLLIFFIPALTIYSTLAMYGMMAQAYKVGKDKLAQTEITPIVA